VNHYFEKLSSNRILLFIGIVFVAFNLRPAITSVGPLVNTIRIDTGLSYGLAGLLTTFPLIAFALISPLAPKLGQKHGNELMVFLGLIILAIGIFFRSTGVVTPLYVGTILVGIGIAVGNVLIPSIIKYRYPAKIGMMTGLYSAAMGVFASFSPGLSTVLSPKIGWENTLSIWGILVIVGCIIWVPQIMGKKSVKREKLSAKPTSVWGSALAWQVTLFMGLQSTIFYCLVAWLPEILIASGMNHITAGWLQSLFQFIGIPAQFIIPLVAVKLLNQKPIAIFIGILSIFGFLGLMISNHIVIITLSIILIGLSQGAALSYALALFSLRTTNGQQAANLSGMAQSIGYLIAAIGPFTLGLMFDAYHSWVLPLSIIMVCSIMMTIFGVIAGRDKVITPLEEHQPNRMVEKF
jgi:MFS transporter, CP family, cyanate transporter